MFLDEVNFRVGLRGEVDFFRLLLLSVSSLD